MSDPALIRACKLWDKVTDKMHEGEYDLPSELDHNENGRPYSSGDFTPLRCRIDGKDAQLVVGSSSGHTAHVNLEKGTVDYYDDDRIPNEIMKQLFEEEGNLKCTRSESGVSCTGLTKEKLDDVFKVLAMPTSMDYRVQHCLEGGESEEVKSNACNDECMDTILNSYNVPSGCDCDEWKSDCVQECVDNWEGEGADEDSCIELEKQFYKDGPKNEELTRAEAVIPAKGQQKLDNPFW